MAMQRYVLFTLVFVNILKLFSAGDIFHFQVSTQPYDYTPIDRNHRLEIDTAKAVVLSSLSPIKVVIATKEQVIVKNDGSGLTIKLNEKSSSTYVTGGPFYNKKYQFSHINIYWGADHFSQAVGSFDGREGTSVVAAINFFKSDYGSYNNSLQYNDGIAIIGLPFTVEGHIPNPTFKQFAKILEKITAANSQYHTICKEAASWLFNSAPYYFAYSTSMYNDGGYYSAISVVPRRSSKTWISIDQFDLFLKLKNFIFEPLDGTSYDYKQEPYTRLIQGYGLKAKIY